MSSTSTQYRSLLIVVVCTAVVIGCGTKNEQPQSVATTSAGTPSPEQSKTPSNKPNGTPVAQPGIKTPAANDSQGTRTAGAAPSAVTRTKTGVARTEGKRVDPKVKSASDALLESADEATGIGAWLKDETAVITPELYEALLLTLAECKLVGRGIDKKCSAYKTLRKVRGRTTAVKDMAGANAILGSRLLRHSSPAVRLHAATMLGSILGTDSAGQRTIEKAARTEAEPAVLRTMLNVVGSRHLASPELTKLFFDMADHADAGVRQEVVGWFLSRFSRGSDATFQKAVTMLASDASEDLRAHACEKLYGSGNPNAVVHMKKYLLAPDTAEPLYQGCFKGLLSTWTGYPLPTEPLQAGYELTLQLLKTTPRTKQRPPWSALSALGAARTKPIIKPNEKWADAVKGWYRMEDLAAALADLAKDRNTKWMARTIATRTIAEIGGSRALIQSIRDAYEVIDLKFASDSHVRKAAEKTLAMMAQ